MPLKVLFFLAIFLLSSASFSFESTLKNEEQSGRVPEIVLSNLASPLSTEARWLFLAGTMATIYIDQGRNNVDNRVQRKMHYHPPLKRYGYVGEVIGWGYLNGLYSLGMLFNGMMNYDQTSLERAELMATASINTLATTVLLKTFIHERRPGFPDEDDSFPSGHSSMSFAFATMVTAEHGWAWGIPAFTVASFISFSRINDNRHWLKDVVAGATLGSSYALGVFLNHRKNNMPFILSVAPTDRGALLNLTAKF